MISESDVERFVQEPGLLVELCREVVARLDAGMAGALCSG